MRALFSIALACLLAAPSALYAQGAPELVEVGANDFRISDVGPEGDADFGAFSAAVAYNPAANEYLVVWGGDEANGEFEIYGQRLDAATGAEVGPDDFRISTTGPDGEAGYRAEDPAVTYNPIDDEYLVVWEAEVPSTESEVYGQRLAADGTELGTDFRISDAGPEGSIFFNTFDPTVVHNPTANEYLVAWSGEDGEEESDADEFEIYGQRLDAATGAEVGANDFRISDLGPEGNSMFFYGARNPAVAYNPAADEYLVVWDGGDDDVPPSSTTEDEVFGQRLVGSTGAEIGSNDFRISDMGPDGSVMEYGVNAPDVTYNAVTEEYFVVWAGDYVTEGASGEEDNGLEVFGQRLDASGAELGANDVRLSDVGPDDMNQRGAAFPSVVTSGEVYLVVWQADDEAAGLSVFEYELFGQLVDATTGTEIGANDVLLSDATPGTTQGTVARADLAYDSVNDEYLAVWTQSVPAPAPAELEAYGQRLAVTGPGTPTEPVASAGDAARSSIYPNPFRSQAQLVLEVTEAQSVRVEVFDALGRRVAVLHEGHLGAGAHRFLLDGVEVPSGLSLIRATGETFAATQKVVRVR